MEPSSVSQCIRHGDIKYGPGDRGVSYIPEIAVKAMSHLFSVQVQLSDVFFLFRASASVEFGHMSGAESHGPYSDLCREVGNQMRKQLRPESSSGSTQQFVEIPRGHMVRTPGHRLGSGLGCAASILTLRYLEHLRHGLPLGEILGVAVYKLADVGWVDCDPPP